MHEARHPTPKPQTLNRARCAVLWQVDHGTTWTAGALQESQGTYWNPMETQSNLVDAIESLGRTHNRRSLNPEERL